MYGGHLWLHWFCSFLPVESGSGHSEPEPASPTESVICVCLALRTLTKLDPEDAGACPQSCLTFYGPVDYSPPGSSVHRILQERILGAVAIPSPEGFFLTQKLDPGLLQVVSCITGRFFTNWATWGSVGKESACNAGNHLQETWVQFLGQEEPLWRRNGDSL